MKKSPFTASGGLQDALSILHASECLSGSRHGNAQPGPWAPQGPSHHPSQKQGSEVAPGQPQLQASGTSLGMEQEPADRPSSVRSMAGQSSGELEPVLLPLTAPGG